MSTIMHLTQYPSIDINELSPDKDLYYLNYKAQQPLRAGSVVPGFTLNKENGRWQQFFNGAEIHGPVLLRQLLARPLVIAFYSHHWLDHGTDLLKHLNAIHHEIKANGGNLLIISNKQDGLEKLAWEHSLSLSFYFDEGNELATIFRTFSEQDPAWNRFSGINVNAPLLSTYVLSTDGEILFDHINSDLTSAFPSKNIISAVYKAALTARQKTA